MPEDDNTLNDELSQAVKLLEGDVVAEPEVKVEAEVTPEVVPEVTPEVIPEVVTEETPETEEQEAA
jgi:hypothetical protein